MKFFKGFLIAAGLTFGIGATVLACFLPHVANSDAVMVAVFLALCIGLLATR